jgi:hypothetical protein
MDDFEKMLRIEQAFRLAFGESVHIITKKIKPGKCSNAIYVPKRFEGHPVTVIIWDKIKYDFKVDGDDIHGQTNAGADVSAVRKEELQGSACVGIHGEGGNN